MPRPLGFKRLRPHCPVHNVQLLVGRTVGAVQYRYCTVPGCHESIRTERKLKPDRRVEFSPAQAYHE
jgi:hypothetical protein